MDAHNNNSPHNIMDSNLMNGIHSACLHHPEEQAQWVCVSCKKLYCPSCVVHRKVGKFTAHVCPDPQCRGRCRMIQVNEASGSIQIAEETQPKPRKKRFGKKGKHPVRFYVSLFTPAIAFITHVVFLFMLDKKPYWPMFIIMAGLLFIMSGRIFWAYAIMALISSLYLLNTVYLVYSSGHLQHNIPLVMKIELGIWIITLVILLSAWNDYPD